MSVNDLIAELQKLPEEQRQFPVAVVAGDCEPEEINDIQLGTIDWLDGGYTTVPCIILKETP